MVYVLCHKVPLAPKGELGKSGKVKVETWGKWGKQGKRFAIYSYYTIIRHKLQTCAEKEGI